ncbi:MULTISPECIES: Lrp/AsnC family transcriptional regulator [Rhodococcus]|uniref:ArsR family transcriptional regulator n=1 Tax=Rhodococcus opacus TaxID=37919 RepID=A0A076F4C2_RHOOP|nr:MULTISPECIES: Lrp/AsnC family transcriptional regulator [Rhodococcus]AII10629.1 ArsR family transcriptional regulator [Rhodococcus opacus]WAM19804.1 Lrp/AsnC family transcriptional regulator [Rhodococcus sp. JS3073]
MRKVTLNGNHEPSAASQALPPEGLDDVDRGILRLLQEDGRMPYRQIARELGVSEGTVRIRLGRMQESGVLNVVAIADPFRLGYRVLAFLLLRVEPGKQDHVVDTLTTWQEATYVSSCIGRADIYVQLVCRDNDHLNELLHRRLPDIGGVREYETFMELKMHKVSYEYSPS